ncbi:MAG TPA: hypothetical protein DCY88_09110 [Cyanobacteria bacterium UBA11372]|nr:hypothetical protein [Cyanobacteria bacterium UBA11372]
MNGYFGGFGRGLSLARKTAIAAPRIILFSHQRATQGALRVYLNGLFLSKVICKTRPYNILICSTSAGN